MSKELLEVPGAVESASALDENMLRSIVTAMPPEARQRLLDRVSRDSPNGDASAALQEGTLVAYVEAEQDVSANVLRDHLAATLPEYMVPSHVVVLTELPRMPNGKVNRKDLPDVEMTREQRSTGYEAPQTDVQRKLTDIWSEMLEVSEIGIRDNFYELGGHSLLATRIAARIDETFGTKIRLRQIFDTPTIAQLSAHVEKLLGAAVGSAVEDGMDDYGPSPTDPIVFVLRSTGSKPPLFLVTGGGSGGLYERLAKQIDEDRPIYALQDSNLGDEDVDEIELTPTEERAKQSIESIKRIQPAGPYHLAGWSYGGIVAYEIAQQLVAAGDEVRFLGMIETYATEWSPYHRKTLAGRLRHTVGGWRHAARIVLSRYHTIPGYVRDAGRVVVARWKHRHDSHNPIPNLKNYVIFAWQDMGRQYLLKDAGLQPLRYKGDRLLLIQDPHVRRVTTMLDATRATSKSYMLKHYPGRVTLFLSAHDPSGRALRDMTMGWGPLVDGGVEVRVTPGNHIALLRPKFVEPLSKWVNLELGKCDEL